MKEVYNSGDTPTIIQTDMTAKDGQNKCPKCGATEISVNTLTGKLRCEYCRFEFEPVNTTGMVKDISSLQGEVIGSGAQDIVASENEVKTFKCSSCGAEVVIDTNDALQARCHWCRNVLSVNEQIPNGAVPDVVLPFSVSKEVAQTEIARFVNKRKFFAHPKFKEEFKTDNIMGVYFPYMLVDVNAHARFSGSGEKQRRKYYRGSGSNQKAYYDADLYSVQREFDIAVQGLSIESNKDRLNMTSSTQTNNIINAIMPFDVENCASYNANYLRGFSSERRNVNTEDLKSLVDVKTKDIVRFATNNTIKEYDRGVLWNTEDVDVKGKQWQASYLPVWLYSYQEVKGDKKVLHYVAVNGRTKKTMGSVPLHMPKLIGVSILVEILGILGMLYIDWDYSYLFVLAGVIFFIFMLVKYRNMNARHTYEKDTKTTMTNLQKVDNFIQTKTNLTNAKMTNANNERVDGESLQNKILDSFTDQNLQNNVMNTVIKNNPMASFIKDEMDKRGGK